MEFDRKEYENTSNLIKEHNLHTVCVEANCPNKYECFSNKTATFMILGDKCTRDCKYCNIETDSHPLEVDEDEPKRILEAVEKLGLDYVVITSVNRDDLEDGGASQFVKVIRILKTNIDCKVEVLIPDFGGPEIVEIIKAQPDVINHNIETVRRVFDNVRPQGSYQKSLELLKRIRGIDAQRTIKVKSGLMVGLGETMDEIAETMVELKKNEVDIITIGQYLAPSSKHFQVQKEYTESEFDEMRNAAKILQFKSSAIGKMVRSSYHAREVAIIKTD